MPASKPALPEESLPHAINLRLSLLGLPTVSDAGTDELTDLAAPIFARHRETTRQLIDPLSPVDHRIQAWLYPQVLKIKQK